MSNTVHQLQDQPLPGEGQPLPGQVARPQPHHALIEDLRSAFNAELTDLLRVYFSEAADALPRMAEASNNEAEYRQAYDCLRIIELEEGRIARAFEREIQRGFSSLLTSAAPVEMERLALLPAEELEENLKLSRMATKARAQYKSALADIDNRIHRLGRDSALPISARALAPLKICEAFRSSLDGLDLEFGLRGTLLNIFERTFMGRLEAVYAAAIRALDQYQILPSDKSPTMPVDKGTLALLTEWSGFSSKASFSDATLASELLDIARGKFAANGDALRQRMALVGMIFGEITADPFILESFHPLFAELHFATLKTALADSSFITHHAHPVRWLVQDAAQMAASARMGSENTLKVTRERLEKLPQEFNISAAFVTPTLATADLLPHNQVHDFLDMVRAETAARRSDLMTKSRRIVSQEIEVCSLGRHLPAAVQQLLRVGMAPLLSWRLLKNGLHSAAWNSAFGNVQRLLECFGTDVQQSTPPADTESLLLAIQDELGQMGLGQDKLGELVQGVREALQTRVAKVAATPVPVPTHTDSPPATAIPVAVGTPPATVSAAAPETPRTPADADLLSELLRPNHWFRVFDAQRNESKWLKVSGYYREHDRVSFAGFNSENVLTLRGSEFVADLKSARSEPINPSKTMRLALEQLRIAG